MEFLRISNQSFCWKESALSVWGYFRDPKKQQQKKACMQMSPVFLIARRKGKGIPFPNLIKRSILYIATFSFIEVESDQGNNSGFSAEPLWVICTKGKTLHRPKRRRTCWHGAGTLRIGEVTCGGSPRLSWNRDQIKMKNYVDRRLIPPKRPGYLTLRVKTSWIV